MNGFFNFFFMFSHMSFVFVSLLNLIILLLVVVAYFTLVERKFMGSLQKRKGPNVIGFLGIFQPLADGLKLFSKETIFPSNANTLLFVAAPIITFILSLLGWLVIPFGYTAVVSDVNLGVLYLFAITSLGVYGIIFAG
jgi:NADH-quinone oxidoreductase subunit H